MSGAGYIYLLSNSKMPGLVKVGRTARDPSRRATELSSVTGVPSPFELIYCVSVEDAVGAEQLAHEILSKWGVRESQAREFFRIDLKKAIDVLLALPNQLEALPTGSIGDPLSPEEMNGYIVQLYQEAVHSTSGTGGFPRDLEAAFAICRKLIGFGRSMFLPKAANIMYLIDEGRIVAGRMPDFRKSKTAAKESLSYSDEACNILAMIAARERDVHNFMIYKNRYIGWLTEDYGFARTSEYVTIANYTGMKAFDIQELLIEEKILRKEIHPSPDLAPFVSDLIWITETLGESGYDAILATLVEFSESLRDRTA